MTPEQQLLIALRFLASGSMQITVADVVRVSVSTICRVLPKVCAAFLEHFDRYIRMPETPDEREAAAVAFYRFAEFPRTIGAIDCTHVKIQSPGGPLSEGYRNRKGYFSLNVQTVSAADTRIINLVARWPGRTHDQTVFRHSRLYNRFEAGSFGRYILVGDSGYANTFYMVTPYTANNHQLAHNVHMQAYQCAIIRTRNVVERQYGILKRRFPALAYGMRVRVTTGINLIAVAGMLHNICLNEHEPHPPDDIDNDRQVEQPQNEIYHSDEVNAPERSGRRRLAREETLDMFRERAQN